MWTEFLWTKIGDVAPFCVYHGATEWKIKALWVENLGPFSALRPCDPILKVGKF